MYIYVWTIDGVSRPIFASLGLEGYRSSLVKFLKFNDFFCCICRQETTKACRKKPEIKKIQLRSYDDIKNEILAKFSNFEVSSVAVFDEVSVSMVTLSTASLV